MPCLVSVLDAFKTLDYGAGPAAATDPAPGQRPPAVLVQALSDREQLAFTNCGAISRTV
jgi:hypothetical protein